MICNEREYRITKRELRRFEEAVDSMPGYTPSEGTDPRMPEIMDDALRSEVEVLSDQIRRYEDLRAGRVERRELDRLGDLPIALIEARIVAGLTQKDLAERLGLKPQQIQRWESSKYSSVGIERLQEIADALGMRVHETVHYALSA